MILKIINEYLHKDSNKVILIVSFKYSLIQMKISKKKIFHHNINYELKFTNLWKYEHEDGWLQANFTTL